MVPFLRTRSSSLPSRNRRQRQSKGSTMLILADGKGAMIRQQQRKKSSIIDTSEHDNENNNQNGNGVVPSSSPRSSMVELEDFDNHGQKNDSDTGINASTNAYLEKIRQKREQNKKRFEELGLGELKSSLAKKRKQKLTVNSGNKRKTAASTSAAPTPAPVRRSSRKGTKPKQYTGDEEELMHETEMRLLSLREKENIGIVAIVDDEIGGGKATTKSRAPPKKIKMRKYNLGDQISAKQREVYQNVPHEEWVKDMKRFCHMKLQNSDTNIKRVMNVVEKLVVGRGIQHPSTGTWFKKGVKVNLSDDFRSMLDEAAQWVYDNGGDRGHGWLIEHPVKKCFVYQQARAENRGAFYSEVKP